MADPNQSLKPFFNYDPKDTVLLLVGKSEEEALVHASYLSNRPDFFKAALSKDWMESQKRVIKLPKDDPATVAQYLDFCYTTKLPTRRESTEDQVESMFIALARLYVYGERVLDSVIRDATIDQLIAFSAVVNHDLPAHPHCPGLEAVEIVYGGATDAAPVRRLLVDLYVRHGSKEWMQPELHAAFCQDVARELLGRTQHGDVMGRPATITRADYGAT